MAQPSIEFLCACLANALLYYYHVERPPVPIEEMLLMPPPDLAGDLALVRWAPYVGYMYRRGLSQRGAVYVHPKLEPIEQRMAMASGLFLGLRNSEGGQAVGLKQSVVSEDAQVESELFARYILMPAHLLPPDWETLAPQVLAGLFEVPLDVAEIRMEELHTEIHKAE